MVLRPDWLPPLAAFEAAARHQNFAHAAEELHLTASAVSHHVRKLEARLGVMLFQRHARGVSLTAEGRRLADAAGNAISDLEAVLGGLRPSEEDSDLVRITALHSLAHTWLLPRLPRFAAAHPQIRLQLDTEIALTRFDSGGPDLGIRYGLGHWPGLTARHLMDEALFPVASPSMPGIDGVRSAADIVRLPLIDDLSRQGWRDWFRAADVRSIKFDEHFIFSDSTDALSAAALCLGAALAREHIAAPYLASGQLIRLPGPSMPTRFNYFAVYPAQRRLRPAARTFVDWLMQEVSPPKQ